MKFYALALAVTVALAPALRAEEAPAAKLPPVVKATADTLLDDFEGANNAAKNGKYWWAGADTNKLGTTLAPDPFVAEKGGSKVSPGHCGRIHGHLGKNQAPYAWVSITLPLAKADLRGYRALRFNVKGNGCAVRVKLDKVSVKDFGYHGADFITDKVWTPVTVSLTAVAQPAWAVHVDNTLNDVEKIEFSPTQNDADYDFSIDDVTLLK